MTLSNTVWAPHKPWKGGLVDRGLPIPDGVEWRTGVRFTSTGCVAPLLQDPCAPADKVPTRTGADAEFLSLNIIQPVDCSTISNIDLERLARERLDSTTEWALGQQLMLDSGALGNPKLTDAVATAYTCAQDALATMLGLASQTGFGAALTVHLSPAAAALLAYKNLDDLDWVDYIVSPGYGEAPAIWVTGATYVGVDTEVVLTGVWREGNNQNVVAEKIGIAFFDPCILIAGTFPADCV